MDRSSFSSLPLDAQLDHLGRALLASDARALPGSDPRALLDLCAAVRDPSPLAWLARRLLDDGWLARPANRSAFSAFLIVQPETAVHKCLRALLEPLPAPAAQPHLAAALLDALSAVPLARLSTMCLVDRALKRHFAEERDAFVERVVRDCETALRTARPADLPLDRLAHVPGTALASLRAIAAAAGSATLAGLRREAKFRAHAAYDTEDEAEKKYPYYETGFMQGNAGIAYALLRLSEEIAGRTDRLILLPDEPFAIPQGK